MHSELKDRTYASEELHPQDVVYDEIQDDIYEEDYPTTSSGGNRVVRLLVIAVIMLVITLGVLYGVVPIVTEWMQPDLPPLAPAVQT